MGGVCKNSYTFGSAVGRWLHVGGWVRLFCNGMSCLGGNLRGVLSGMTGMTMNIPNLGLFAGLWLVGCSSVCLESCGVISCVKVFWRTIYIAARLAFCVFGS